MRCVPGHIEQRFWPIHIILQALERIVDQGDTGEAPAAEAVARGIRLEVGKVAGAKRGFVLLPRRWVVERSCFWAGRFRRLARDNERLDATLASFPFVACALLALHNVLPLRWVLYVQNSSSGERQVARDG